MIRSIDWVVQNKDQYDIRVLNCSFSAPPVSCYWDGVYSWSDSLGKAYLWNDNLTESMSIKAWVPQE